MPLERLVDFQEGVVAAVAVGVKFHADHAVAFVDGIEQRVVALLAHTQGLLRAFARADVAGGAKPLDHFAVVVEHGNGARMRPAQAAVDTDHAVLEFEHALALHRVAHRQRDHGLVFPRDVQIEPAVRGRLGVAQEFLAFEMAHFGPVGTHAVDHIRGRTEKAAKTLLALRHGLLYRMPLQIVAHLVGKQLEQTEFDLAGRLLAGVEHRQHAQQHAGAIAQRQGHHGLPPGLARQPQPGQRSGLFAALRRSAIEAMREEMRIVQRCHHLLGPMRGLRRLQQRSGRRGEIESHELGIFGRRAEDVQGRCMGIHQLTCGFQQALEALGPVRGLACAKACNLIEPRDDFEVALGGALAFRHEVS